MIAQHHMMTNNSALTQPPRFSQLSLEAMEPYQLRVAAEILAFTGSIRGPFNMMLRSPKLADLCLALGQYLLFSSPLPSSLVEMAVLMRARYSHSDYEWWAHVPRAMEAGLCPEIIRSLANGQRPQLMTSEEAVIYEYCTELLTTHAVSDATFELATILFGHHGVVDLTAILGFYAMIATMLRVAQVNAPDNSRPLPVVEAPFRAA